MHDIQNPGNRFKLEGTVTLKESHTISAPTEDTFKRNAQITELYSRLVDPNGTIGSEPTMMVFGGSATTGGPAAWGKLAWSPFCW